LIDKTDLYDRKKWIEKRLVAANLRNGLRFISNTDLQEACDGFADYWLARLQSGKDIYVGTSSATGPFSVQSSKPYYKSNQLVLTKILESLQRRHDPDNTYADRIHLVGPAHTQDDNLRQQVLEHGLIFVDDWSVSGTQMAVDVRGFKDIPGYAKQINFVCAPANHIDKNIGGAKIRSYFRRPPIYGTRQAGTTGSHADTDYGFRTIISELYTDLQQHAPDNQSYSYPLLYRIARVYRPGDYMRNLPATGQYEALEERSEAFRICVEALKQRIFQG
jgi:hypothetical protein